MWPFRKAPDTISADALFARWFRVQVPEGHASLEAFDLGVTSVELELLPKTLEKLALDGVERIYQVRKHDLEPNRDGLVYLDSILNAELRWKLTEEQDPNFPRNLFRLVCTEFGCIVGEIFVRAGKATWSPRRAPNHWRSTVVLSSGIAWDPFRAVVKQLSDEREDGALVEMFDHA